MLPNLTPPPATIEQYIRFKESLGITNSVLIHGLSYGANVEFLKNFVKVLGQSSTKGIGVLDPDTVTPEALRDMHNAGIRSIRVNMYRYNAMHDVETHPEFWESKPVIEQEIMSAGILQITDHFALLKGPSVLSPECDGDVARQVRFEDIIELVRQGLLYVMLSACYRISNEGPSYRSLRSLVRFSRGAIGMKVRTNEEVIRETPFLVVDDPTWLERL
ncbi:hypothetical protein ETB97_008596 [Aspergillus alliaceus]|uniref:Amidohydrolase-related domain-containing protein n=1 Tax=Petromyces alliaceus TaxID=209559 RepID=A0A8H5ZUZ5_PETAA|nr:hypothetical protein ETB97_008596 [Aspergillus burnettii]